MCCRRGSCVCGFSDKYRSATSPPLASAPVVLSLAGLACLASVARVVFPLLLPPFPPNQSTDRAWRENGGPSRTGTPRRRPARPDAGGYSCARGAAGLGQTPARRRHRRRRQRHQHDPHAAPDPHRLRPRRPHEKNDGVGGTWLENRYPRLPPATSPSHNYPVLVAAPTRTGLTSSPPPTRSTPTCAAPARTRTCWASSRPPTRSWPPPERGQGPLAAESRQPAHRPRVQRPRQLCRRRHRHSQVCRSLLCSSP